MATSVLSASACEWFLKQRLGVYAQMLVQRPGHRHGDVFLSGHDCCDFAQAADVGDQVMESQPPLIHLELNGCYGVGRRPDGIVSVLKAFDQVGEDVALVAFRCANLGLKYLAESGQRGVVVFFRTDRVYCLPYLHLLHVY